jgi:hypothetical protein
MFLALKSSKSKSKKLLFKMYILHKVFYKAKVAINIILGKKKEKKRFKGTWARFGRAVKNSSGQLVDGGG